MPKTPFSDEDYADAAIKLHEENDPKREQMMAAINEHVIGQTITKVESTRTLDKALSEEMGQIVEVVELSVYLGNNICYLYRVVCPALTIIVRGDGLAHVPEGHPEFVKP